MLLPTELTVSVRLSCSGAQPVINQFTNNISINELIDFELFEYIINIEEFIGQPRLATVPDALQK